MNRQERRAAERRERNRSQVGYSHAEWVALSRIERKQITETVKTVCVICGGEDGPECAPCTARHDHAVARTADV